MNQASKFSFLNVYLWMLFLLTIFVSIIYFICRTMILHTEFDSNIGAAFGSLLILILIGFALYQLAKFAAHIVIDTDSIIIKKVFRTDKIYKSDIKTIDLFARKSLGFLNQQNNVNGISIQTRDQRAYFFADLYYQNISQLKNTLYNNFNDVIKNKESYADKYQSTSYSLKDAESKKFSGNYILSFNGATIIISAVVCVIVFKIEESVLFLIAMSFFFLFLLIIPFAYQAYYFIISGNLLIVKNQILWWKEVTYELSKIQSVIIERGYRRSNSLRINTIDFSSKFFLAGSLRDKTWRQLIEEFKNEGIEVQNEAYLYS